MERGQGEWGWERVPEKWERGRHARDNLYQCRRYHDRGGDGKGGKEGFWERD